MFVQVDLRPARPVVTLEDPDDCARFHVSVLGKRDRRLVLGALIDAAAGAVQDEHAWITVDALRRMSAGRVGDDWGARFDGMIGYARTKGWLNDSGNLVRAHVEYQDQGNLRWQIGDVVVTRVVEQMITAGASDLLPMASRAELSRHAGWLQPWAIDADDRLQLSIHALCVEAGGQKLVVDTCFGPGPLPEGMQERCADATFLTALAEEGFGRADVDLVICTHLHVDHVGWNTVAEGDRRVPTFPNARYLLSRTEFEHWNALSDDARRAGAVITFDDSVTPLFEHDVVDLVESDHQVNDEIRLVPTPGHSPGHVSVLITSQGQRALITGDCTHSPVQFAEPDWACRVDHDPDLSCVTRRRLIEEYADTQVLVIGTHFPPPTAGHLVTTDVGVEFQALMP